MAGTPRVGVQLQQQHCTIGELRDAWVTLDELRVDSLWLWDHLLPQTGDPGGERFECWTLLAAMAVGTSAARIGPLVCCAAWRNPDLLAEMAHTVDRLSGGRLMLGLGAGWFEREFESHGYPFRRAAERLDVLEDTLARVRARLASPRAGSVGRVPLLVGGQGESRTLAIAARSADAWNCYGWDAPDPVENFASKTAALDRWCERLGRDPHEVERSVMVDASDAHLADALLAAGADEVVVTLEAPFQIDVVRGLIERVRTVGSEGTGRR